jgi:hypothetical protein
MEHINSGSLSRRQFLTSPCYDDVGYRYCVVWCFYMVHRGSVSGRIWRSVAMVFPFYSKFLFYIMDKHCLSCSTDVHALSCCLSTIGDGGWEIF